MLAATGYQLNVERGPDWLLVRVRGVERGAANTGSLAIDVWTLAQTHFTYRIVLQLDQVPVLDSEMISQLLGLSQQLQAHDGVLRLCGLSAYNRRILRTCALENRFPLYQTREEAVQGGRDPRLPR